MSIIKGTQHIKTIHGVVCHPHSVSLPHEPLHAVKVVDLEPMIAKYGHTSRYLRDFIHPQTFLNVELFNIYLNLLRDHGRLQLGRDHHHPGPHGQS